MPTYEYRCQFCHRVSDAFQRMSDAPLVKCPYCGKEGLERIVSGGAGVIYKGEGWYVTDYSKKSSGGKEPGTKTEVKTGAATPETQSNKPEAAPAPKSSEASTKSSEASSTKPN